MIVPLASLIEGFVAWEMNKAVPALWAAHTNACPPVTRLKDDMPAWKQEIYRIQCVKPIPNALPGDKQVQPIPNATPADQEVMPL